MKPSVSLIIPCYNGSKFLKNLVSDLQKQTLDNFEILILDDGSTDDSKEIIEQLDKDYENVKGFYFKNAGLGPTRQRGIELANGEFIYFLDQDDYIFDETLEVLYQTAIENKSDIVVINSINTPEEEINHHSLEEIPLENVLESPYSSHSILKNETESGKDFLLSSINSKEGLFPPIWLYFYKAEFLKNAKTQFLPIVHEDNAFTMEILFEASAVYYLDNIFHQRRIIATSLSHQNKSENHILGSFACCNKSLELYNHFDLSESEKEIWKTCIYLNWGLVYDTLKKSNNNLKNKYKKDLIKLTYDNKSILSYKLIAKAVLL